MVRTISTDLGATPTYARRELTALVGAGWPDGREATVWLLTSHAKKRRVGTRYTSEVLSRYAVSEVEEVGFLGRSFVFDKEFGEEYTNPSLPQPPYVVRIDVHGVAWCQCLGDKGGQAISCRHCDAVLALLSEGAFEGDSPSF